MRHYVKESIFWPSDWLARATDSTPAGEVLHHLCVCAQEGCDYRDKTRLFRGPTVTKFTCAAPPSFSATLSHRLDVKFKILRVIKVIIGSGFSRIKDLLIGFYFGFLTGCFCACAEVATVLH